MEARIIKNRQQWNEFVAGSEEQCNVTQSYEWGQLLTTLDGEVLYVGVVDDEGKMCAAMLLLVSRVAVSNSVYFYAPRGPIIDDPDSAAMTVLLNYVKALAHKYHAFMLKIEPGVPDNDPRWLSALHRRGFIANPEALHLRHEWVLDIRLDEQTLLADMKKTWRYCVRLASRKDVTVRRGESLADIDTFYRILQTTSQRDTFMIYDKSFYEKLVELYGQAQNVALFIAEYEGQALGASLLVKMGRWCWYMYGASSNEHRDRMPNHLLQWTAIRWAKEQGCWYYNFRGIPDVLEESQPMWGVYLFKSGFGGYAMRALETHDLPYNPLLYRLYRSWLDGRGWLKDVRTRRHSKQLEAEKPEKTEKTEQVEPAEKQEKQSASPKATAIQTDAKPKQAERRERTAEKQPRQFKQLQEQNPSMSLQLSQTQQQSTTPPAPDDSNSTMVDESNLMSPDDSDLTVVNASNLMSPDDSDLTVVDEPNPMVVEGSNLAVVEDSNPMIAEGSNLAVVEDSNPMIVDDPDLMYREAHTVNHISQDVSNHTFPEANASDPPLQESDISNLIPQEADTFDPTLQDASNFMFPEADTSNLASQDADASNLALQDVDTSNPRGADLSRTDPIYGEGIAPQAIPTESPIEETASESNTTTEEILQQIIGSAGRKTSDTSAHVEPQMQPAIEQINAEKWPEGGEIENLMEHVETRDEPEAVQSEPTRVGIEDSTEHMETEDEPIEIQPELLQAGAENSQEDRETRDDNVPPEPEAQLDIDQQEELEDQDAFNEVTQKLPRIQMEQKYARRPTDDVYGHDGMNGTGGQKK